jgi:hypothetical protein
MSRIRFFALAGLSCLIAALSVQCSRPKSEKAPTAAALKPADDFKATMDAYGKAKDPEAKIRLWLDFLSRNPNSSYTLGAINYVVTNHYLEQKKDPEGAVDFAIEHMAKITDAKLKRRADSALVRLYGRVGKKDQLRQFAGQIQARRGLDLGEHLAVADAAVEAKDWDLARTHCEALLKENTPDKIRSDPAFEKSTDEELRKRVEQNRGQALVILGRAALESNDTKAALAHFAEAGKLARYDYAGLPCWPFEDLNLHWARALLKDGDPRAALGKISRDAIIQEKKEALAVLADAHRAAGIEGDLQRYIERVKPTIVRKMPVFSAYDYDKKKVSYDQLKGTITLLTFWFPT